MAKKHERHGKKISKTGSNPLGFLTIAALAVAYIASPARAETDPVTEVGVHSAGMQSIIEEIVVVAKRRPEFATPALDAHANAHEDPLQDQIARHAREYGQLEEELEWRTSSALAIEFPQFDLGYDPRDDNRSATQAPSAVLPLDVVSPATVFRVDF